MDTSTSMPRRRGLVDEGHTGQWLTERALALGFWTTKVVMIISEFSGGQDGTVGSTVTRTAIWDSFDSGA